MNAGWVCAHGDAAERPSPANPEATPVGGRSLVTWIATFGTGIHVCWRLPDGTTGWGYPPEWGAAPPYTPPPGAEIADIAILTPFGPDGTVVGPPRSVCMLDDAGLPPPPPTAEEVWDLVPIPQPAVHVSPPDGSGLAGLPAWFWADPASSAPVRPPQITIRGYTATVVVTLAGYQWDPDDGTGLLTSTTPGSPTNPAVRHPYREQGTYTVEHAVRYTATYTLTGHGVTVVDQDLGFVAPVATLDYDVGEREAVIVG